MQSPHPLGGLDINGVLFFVSRSLITGDKAEQPDIFIKLGKGEFVLLPFLQVVKAEAGKIGNQNITGRVSILESGEIILGLLKGAVYGNCSLSAGKLPIGTRYHIEK